MDGCNAWPDSVGFNPVLPSAAILLKIAVILLFFGGLVVVVVVEVSGDDSVEARIGVVGHAALTKLRVTSSSKNGDAGVANFLGLVRFGVLVGDTVGVQRGVGGQGGVGMGDWLRLASMRPTKSTGITNSVSCLPSPSVSCSIKMASCCFSFSFFLAASNSHARTPVNVAYQQLL